MTRRDLLWSAAASGLASLPSVSAAASSSSEEKTWLFWDLWKLDMLQGAELRQGKPQLQPDASYEDPLLGSLSSWPAVIRSSDSGGWRMYYSAEWRPLTLLCAESEDGIRWRPMTRPAGEFASDPGGAKKIAPHHLYTLPSGSGGSVYADPVADDGYPCKIFAIQSGEITHARALNDENHQFHEYAKKAQPQRYFSDHLTVVSKDGVRWKADYDAIWNKPHWHPEPPVYAYYNSRRAKHFMTSRPGHGDRRVVILDSNDARRWSEPELLFQPDPTDEPLIQFYGMPVIPYEGAFVGLLWVFHPAQFDVPDKYNYSLGRIDCQLAYSYDGVRFNRGFRQPLIGLEEQGKYGGGHFQPSSLTVVGDEIRIYSTAARHTHGMGSRFDGRREGLAAITMHTLRRDGFTYLQSKGGWAGFVSKPWVLRGDSLTMNAAAPQGEIRYQVTTLESEPIPGLTFDDCVPLREGDSTAWRLRWKERSLGDVVGKPIRLAVRFLHGKIYSFRGDYHFIDAQDWHLLDGGKPIDPRWFDY